MTERIPDSPAPRRVESTTDEDWEEIMADRRAGVRPPWRDEDGVIYTDKVPSWASGVVAPRPAGTRDEPAKVRHEVVTPVEGMLRLEPGTDLYAFFESEVLPEYDFYDEQEPEPDAMDWEDYWDEGEDEE